MIQDDCLSQRPNLQDGNSQYKTIGHSYWKIVKLQNETHSYWAVQSGSSEGCRPSASASSYSSAAWTKQPKGFKSCPNVCQSGIKDSLPHSCLPDHYKVTPLTPYYSSALRSALYSPECSSPALVGNLGTAWQLICKKIICPLSNQEMFFILTIGAKHVKEDLGCNSMHLKCQITWRRVYLQARPRDLWARDCSPARIILNTFQVCALFIEGISPLKSYFTCNFSGTRNDIVKLLPQLGPSPGIILPNTFIQ